MWKLVFFLRKYLELSDFDLVFKGFIDGMKEEIDFGSDKVEE